MSGAVLIVGAGILQTYFIREAHALGLYVIATDGDPQALGGALADEPVVLDTYDIEGHQRLARQLAVRSDHVFRGVATCGADVAPTVAAAAEVAGIPGIPYEVACVTHDKAQVRRALRAAGLERYQPAWQQVRTTWSWSAHEHMAKAVGYPLVVKPLHQRASRGITLVFHQDALPDAIEKARLSSGEEWLLMEHCLTGTEHSAEIIFGSYGFPVFFNIVDRLFTYTDGIPIETGHVNPTALPREQQDAMHLMLCRAADALGVRWGPFKADVMLTAEGPKILECTARLSGGFDSQMTSPLTGRHPMRTVLQLACGILEGTASQPPMAQATGYAACAAILPQKQGRVVTTPTRWTELGSEIPGSIAAVVWCVKQGDVLDAREHNAQRPGFVIAHAATHHDAWQRAQSAAAALATAMEIA